jgi:NAD(P)-dependent dehydrogenase (short-subunit alcohol dehydrogenase family)
MGRVFEGKLAFVTGAGSGIGAATSRLLASRGARVVVADIDLDAATQIASDIEREGGDALPLRVDVSDPASVGQAIARATQDGADALDLAVNAAGITGNLAPCAEFELADWQRIIGVNLTGTFLCMRAQVASMLRKGAGAIVNVSSIMGSHALPGAAAYAASKHGVEGLTKAAALDYAKQGIRINAVAPGYVDTPMIAGRKQAVQDKIVAMHPIGRIAQPGELAKVIAFLLSDDASFVTGSIHLADGGFSAV